MTNEVVDLRKKQREPGLLCKLNLKKAYDLVNWEFLDLKLLKRTLGSNRGSGSIFCFTLVRYSVLVNDSPCGFCGCSRGLRQGGPLSPMLLILVMESLSIMMYKTIDIFKGV